jgi:hypothetical protein
VGFHQLLNLNKNTRDDCWGNNIKGWWRRGDIKDTKCKKTRECWVKSPANVPIAVARDIKEALMTPGKNYGKDSYTIDLITLNGRRILQPELIEMVSGGTTHTHKDV